MARTITAKGRRGGPHFRSALYVVAAVGVFLVPVSLDRSFMGWVAKSSVRSSTISPDTEAEWKAQLEHVVSGPIAGLSDVFTPIVSNYVDLTMKVDFPSSVYADSDFIVRASGIVGSSFVTKERSITSLTEKTVNDPSWNSTKLQGLFDAGRLGLVLSIGGADVKPEGLALLSKGEAVWVVTPKHAGTLKGFLRVHPNLTVEEVKSGLKENNAGFFFAVSPSSEITVSSIDRILTRERVLSSIVGFFGAFLTLPGIIAFIQARRKRAQKQKSNENSPPLIISP